MIAPCNWWGNSPAAVVGLVVNMLDLPNDDVKDVRVDPENLS